MFNKLKQFRDLRSKAKDLQSKLAQEKIIGSANGGKVQIEMDGNQKALKVMISPEVMNQENREKLEDNIKDAINDAMKSLQKVMAKKMQEQGGLGALKDMLG